MKNSKTMIKGGSFMIRRFVVCAAIMAAVFVYAVPSEAAFSVTDKDGNELTLGVSLQLQYREVNPAAGQTTDEAFVRRFEVSADTKLNAGWGGKLVVDFGKASGDNEVTLKEAYVSYTGFDGLDIKFGNAYFPFSREVNTSSKRQQFVERTFPGDHDYGTPERNLGLHVDAKLLGGKIRLAASGASASIDPDNKRLDFDSPVVKEADFNEGSMVGARVDFHPFGELKLAQGDFDGALKATISAAAFSWNNDGDKNTYTSAVTLASTSTTKFDVDSVDAFEVSGAFRFKGVSIDAEYNEFKAKTVADFANTGGIFLRGETTLTNSMIKGGYMVLKDRLELVAGIEAQDADNYKAKWKRTSYGANWFFNNHNTKVQLTLVDNKNVDGVKRADAKETFVQAQYVF